MLDGTKRLKWVKIYSAKFKTGKKRPSVARRCSLKKKTRRKMPIETVGVAGQHSMICSLTVTTLTPVRNENFVF